MSERYSIQEIPDATTELGIHFRVTDNSTDSRIGTCYQRENAELICHALNTSARQSAREPHLEGKWCKDLTCAKCYSADFRFKHSSQSIRQAAMADVKRLIRKRQEERFAEHGTTESDTNAQYYGGRNGDELAARDEEGDDIIEAIERAAGLPAGVAVVPVERFYLQDSRRFVGNDCVWWKSGGNGYTTNLQEADTFISEDAKRMHRMRETDIPWPVDYIDKKSRPTVDHQHLDSREAMIGSAR